MYRVDSRPPVLAEEPPSRGLSRPVRWLIGIMAAALVGGLAAAGATAVIIYQQYPATVSIPETALGLPKSPELTQLWFDSLPDPIAKRNAPDGSMFFQAYFDPDTRKLVQLYAASGFVLRPGHDLPQILGGWASAFESMGEVTAVPAGDLGGAAACVNVKQAKIPGVMCGWADHGTIGIVGFPGTTVKDRDEAARAMLDIREAVVTR